VASPSPVVEQVEQSLRAVRNARPAPMHATSVTHSADVTAELYGTTTLVLFNVLSCTHHMLHGHISCTSEQL